MSLRFFLVLGFVGLFVFYLIYILLKYQAYLDDATLVAAAAEIVCLLSLDSPSITAYLCIWLKLVLYQ